jgi:hypothetical protein
MSDKRDKPTKTRATRARRSVGKRTDEAVMFFQVWRVLTPLVLPNWDSFDGYNSSKPFATTEKKLSEVCAWKEGGGDYVAFQLSESGEGYPLSYWVIKVRDRERHNATRVYPDEELIKILREEFKPSGLIASLFFRRYLAAITSLCLRELEEPKARGSKETPQVAFVRSLRLRAPSLTRAEVVKLTIEKNKTKKWWDPNLSEEAQEGWAEQTYKSASKAMERTQSGRVIRKARKIKGIRSKKK